jgi:hypothetical protein
VDDCKDIQKVNEFLENWKNKYRPIYYRRLKESESQIIESKEKTNQKDTNVTTMHLIEDSYPSIEKEITESEDYNEIVSILQKHKDKTLNIFGEKYEINLIDDLKRTICHYIMSDVSAKDKFISLIYSKEWHITLKITLSNIKINGFKNIEDLKGIKISIENNEKSVIVISMNQKRNKDKIVFVEDIIKSVLGILRIYFFSNIEYTYTKKIEGVDPIPIPTTHNNDLFFSKKFNDIHYHDEKNNDFNNFFIKSFLDDDLVTGIRRYSVSCERNLPEDKLLDMVIAWEFFLGTGSKDSLAYKLSTRISRLSHSDSGNRICIYKEMKKLYDLRSNIVHGNIKDKNYEPILSNINIYYEFIRINIKKIIKLMILENSTRNEINSKIDFQNSLGDNLNVSDIINLSSNTKK